MPYSVVKEITQLRCYNHINTRMLAKRIIPCLDVKDGRVVKGVNFVNLRDAGDPVEIARIYDMEGADELIFLDITASHEKRDIIIDVVKKTAEQVFIPLTVGGGIRNLDDIRKLLNAGADKISINSAAVKTPEFIEMAAKRFGSQCIVVAIDVKRKEKQQISENEIDKSKAEPSWEVYINGGRIAVDLDALEWVKEVAERGAGEILLTSMDCDGTKDGFDVELTRAVSESVEIPVIASGGAGNQNHFLEIFSDGKADAALAASIFHYGECKIGEIKNFLAKEGIAVRQL